MNNFEIIVTSARGYEPNVRIHFTANSDVKESTTTIQGPALDLLAGVSRIVCGLVQRGMPKSCLNAAIELGFEMAEKEDDEE